jgi:hypothetical protein
MVELILAKPAETVIFPTSSECPASSCARAARDRRRGHGRPIRIPYRFSGLVQYIFCDSGYFSDARSRLPVGRTLQRVGARHRALGAEGPLWVEIASLAAAQTG